MTKEEHIAYWTKQVDTMLTREIAIEINSTGFEVTWKIPEK